MSIKILAMKALLVLMVMVMLAMPATVLYVLLERHAADAKKLEAEFTPAERSIAEMIGVEDLKTCGCVDYELEYIHDNPDME